MNPMRFLTSTDIVEVNVMKAIADKMDEMRAEANKAAQG